MENRIDILNELKDLSPVIAGLEKVNVFSVPQGYFEYLPADIMAGIESEQGLKNGPSSISSSHEIPQGYFDTLTENILNKIKLQEDENAPVELKTLSALLYSIQNENVFKVPQGYFNTLADTVLQKIMALDVQHASDELRSLSPMLYSIQNENVFEVPQGYFKNLSEDILSKVIPQPKVVVMRKRSNTFFKYAIAAAFTGAMALGVFKFTKNDSADTNTIIAQGTQIARENKFDQELAKVTDADIVKYLEATGSDVNAAVVANSIDENELPSQEEYLMDDKALDKYLNSINVDASKN